MNTCTPVHAMIHPDSLTDDAWMNDPIARRRFEEELERLDKIFPADDKPECPGEDLDLIVY